MPRTTNDKKTKNKLNSNNKKKSNIKTKDEKFSFDEEIVIGLRRIDDELNENISNKKTKSNKKKTAKTKTKTNKKEKPKTKNKKNEETELIIKSKYMQNYDNDEDYNNSNAKKTNQKKTRLKKTNKNKKTKTKKLTPKQQAAKRRRKIIFKIIRWLILIGIIIAGIIYAMLSPIFNITDINVIGNSKISSETIISLSDLNIGQNIFDFRTSNIIENIKENAYIDTVEINRKFPDEIEIVITEREATYMITLGNAYVYINNQGYILEITSVKGDFPLIVGYETSEEQIQTGNRLDAEDLEKLNDVLKIVETASSMDSEVTNLITQIDISDKSNYILTLEEEGKEVYLGDITNLSTKILWINELLEIEKDNEGIIYLNVDLNSDRPYFRENID